MRTDPQAEAAADAMSTEDSSSSDSGADIDDAVLERVKHAEAAVAQQPGSYDAHLQVCSAGTHTMVLR